MEYDYYEAVETDVLEYIRDNVNLNDWRGNREELEEYLQDELWVEDAVTGNASGSYTFSTYTAEKYLCHNWDLLEEALDEFGQSNINILAKGPEWCDVSIRCYVLSSAISRVLDTLEDELEEVEDEE